MPPPPMRGDPDAPRLNRLGRRWRRHRPIPQESMVTSRSHQTQAGEVAPAAGSGQGGMNVAYDLRYAADHFTGIGTHAHALLEALLEQPGGERFTVLWNPALPARRFDLEAIARHPRVFWVERHWQP